MQDDNPGRKPSGNDTRAQRILDAAYELLLRYGYDKTTVSDIAKEAGVSKGAIYLHFASREALFEALVLRESVRFGEAYIAEIETDPEGGTIAGIYRHSIRLMPDYPLIRAIFARDKRILGDMLRHIDPKVYLAGYLMRVEFIRKMQAAGLVRPELDPQGVGFVLALIGQGFLVIDEIIPTEFAPSLETFIDTLSVVLANALEIPAVNGSQKGKAIFRELIGMARREYGSDPPPSEDNSTE